MATAMSVAVVARPARSATAGDPAAENGIVRMQVIGQGGMSDGTCFLIRNERIEGGVVQYFVTAAHLFGPPLLGDESSGAYHVRLTLADGSSIETNAAHVVFPAGVDVGADLAVVRIVSAATRLIPVRVSPDPPAVGGLFMIRGSGSALQPVSVERVRFRSSRFIIGDRSVTESRGLIGAPAVDERGVFGVTSYFGTNGTPVVSLITAAADFLDRAAPDWNSSTTVRPTFHIDRRSIEGPLLTVACDAASTGDLEVPVPLAPTEAIVDADAHLSNPSSLRLGDLTILSLEDRSVKLRFTMIGTPPPALAPPTACPAGQALVTVGVNVLVVPRR